MSMLDQTEGSTGRFRSGRFRFDLLSLLGWTALCAIVVAIPRQPMLAGVLIFTYPLLLWSPLSPDNSLIATVIHNSLVGIVGGLTAGAIALVVSLNLGDKATASAATGILTGPLVGMIFGWICAVVRRR